MGRKYLLIGSVFMIIGFLLTNSGVLTALAAGDTWIVNAALADNSGCVAPTRQCKTIQAAIDAATAGDTILVKAGTYVENVFVTKSLTLAGAGAAYTTIYPAVSNPNPCSGSSLCGSRNAASNIILVEANDVTIYGFTLNGDNPSLTSGLVRNGADLDARNGIIGNYYLGVLNNLTIYATTVKNIYLRGIYASTGGSFNIHHNTVENVDGESQSIAIMNWSGTGTISFNTVTTANDGIVSNWSKGTQYLNNTVTNSSSGIHSDNNQTTGDLLAFNTVSNCRTYGYGVWVFSPFVAPRVEGNHVTNCYVGLAVARQNAAVTPILINNQVDGGGGGSGSFGIYITTDGFGWGSTNVSASLVHNAVTNADWGIFLEEQPGYTMSVTMHYNNISGNAVAGVEKEGASSVDAETNWWGSSAGPGVGGNNIISGTVDADPWATAIIYSTTGSTHEVGETATLDSHVNVTGMYGAQLLVNHDSSVLSFTSGVHHDVPTATPPWAWDLVVENFVPVTGGIRLSGSMQAPTHTVGANLTGESIATWTYTCSVPGNSSLLYDTTIGIGTLLSDLNGFAIPTALTGGWITCLAETATSVDGYIKLQGRLGTSPSPAGWNDAIVTLTCIDTVGGCAGYGPYYMTTDATGHYQLLKTGPGTGVALGNYSVSVTRRAYLGATKANPVTIVAGSNTINTVNTAPTLLGGDVTGDGRVGIGDVSAIGGAFGSSVTPDTGSDVNGDGFVNIFDLVLAGGNFDQTTSTWTP